MSVQPHYPISQEIAHTAKCRSDSGVFKFMASPQTENGYTKIADELLEHLVKTALLGAEWRIVIFIIRKTYGYGKKKDWISFTQFEKATDLSRPTVNTTLKNLIKKNILVKTALLEYYIQKDWEKWVVNPASLVKHKDLTGLHRLTETGKDRLTHNRQINNTIDSIPTAKAVDPINQMFEIFYKTINPTINFANSAYRKACETLIEKIGLEKTLIAAKYAISVQDKRYAPVITNPLQLLNKYGELQAYYSKEKNIIKSKESKTLIL